MIIATGVRLTSRISTEKPPLPRGPRKIATSRVLVKSIAGVGPVDSCRQVFFQVAQPVVLVPPDQVPDEALQCLGLLVAKYGYGNR